MPLDIFPLDFFALNTVHIVARTKQDKLLIIEDHFQNYVILSVVENSFEQAREYLHLHQLKFEEQERIIDSQSQIIFIIYMPDAQIDKTIIEKIATQPFFQQIYEADLPVIKKYLIHKKITPLQLHQISIDTACPNKLITIEPKYDLREQAVSHDPIFIKFDKLRVVAFDIETYAPDKYINTKNPILSISVYTDQKHVVFTHSPVESSLSYVKRCESEAVMLKEFCTFLNEHADVICGYNSDGFDLPYIYDRAKILDVDIKIGPLQSPISLGSGQTKTASIKGLPHIDLYPFIRTTMRNTLETTSLSLNAVSQELLGDKKKEVNIETLYQAWDTRNARHLDEFFAYNLHDAKLCYKLFELLYPNMIEFVKMIQSPLQDICRMSYSQLVEWYLINRAKEFSVVVPNRPTNQQVQKRLLSPKNEGAFVLSPTPGFYKNIAVFDFQSLYPSIIASLNIEGATILSESQAQKTSQALKVPQLNFPLYIDQSRPGFIPQVIADIVKRRVELKKQLKITTAPWQKELIKARIYNLKILANSLYGYLAFAYARWHSNESAAATTAFARHYIKETIEQAKRSGFHVIYSDTDSIFLELREKTADDAKHFVNSWNESLPGIMELQLEDFYDTAIFVAAKGAHVSGGAKKRYAMYKKSTGSFKITGLEYVRIDWTQLAKKIQYQILEDVLAKNDPQLALKHIKHLITQVKLRKIDLDQYILQERLSRNIDEYESNLPQVMAAKLLAQKQHVGKGTLVQFIIATGKGALYEKVRLPNQIAMAEVDIDYYINNQIIPAVSSIMEVFGIKKDELISQTTQGNLDQFF